VFRASALVTGAIVLLLLGVHGAGLSRAAAQPAGVASLDPVPEIPEVLPEGAGREEAFYRCTACHGTAVIRRSHLSRERWDELMDWMTEKHGMPPLDGEERRLIVDYLAGAFPPQQRRRGGANPFLAD
jgi:mono/diheme cytochrome c family protein